MTLTLDFQGEILKMLYLRNGMAEWHGTKGMWVNKMLHPLCDFQLSPHPWPWPWIFKVKFWKRLILWMGWPIDMERKGCESIEWWTHVVTFNVHLFHDLDLGFSRSNFEKVVWVDRMLDSHCDFKLWPQPLPWSPCGCGDLSVRMGSRISPHRNRVVVEVHWRCAQGWRSISWVVATFSHVGGSFNLSMAATGDVWIIPSFRIWGYVLHVEHISCVITNCSQLQWAIPSLFSIAL